jgi:hypothetical protein
MPSAIDVKESTAGTLGSAPHVEEFCETNGVICGDSPGSCEILSLVRLVRRCAAPYAAALQAPRCGWAAETDMLAFRSLSAFPKEHWAKTYSTGTLERLKGEIERRTRWAWIFPNGAAIVLLGWCHPAGTNDEWRCTIRNYPNQSARCGGLMAQPSVRSATLQQASYPRLLHPLGGTRPRSSKWRPLHRGMLTIPVSPSHTADFSSLGTFPWM